MAGGLPASRLAITLLSHPAAPAGHVRSGRPRSRSAHRARGLSRGTLAAPSTWRKPPYQHQSSRLGPRSWHRSPSPDTPPGGATSRPVDELVEDRVDVGCLGGISRSTASRSMRRQRYAARPENRGCRCPRVVLHQSRSALSGTAKAAHHRERGGGHVRGPGAPVWEAVAAPAIPVGRVSRFHLVPASRVPVSWPRPTSAGGWGAPSSFWPRSAPGRLRGPGGRFSLRGDRWFRARACPDRLGGLTGLREFGRQRWTSHVLWKCRRAEARHGHSGCEGRPPCATLWRV